MSIKTRFVRPKTILRFLFPVCGSAVCAIYCDYNPLYTHTYTYLYTFMLCYVMLLCAVCGIVIWSGAAQTAVVDDDTQLFGQQILYNFKHRERERAPILVAQTQTIQLIVSTVCVMLMVRAYPPNTYAHDTHSGSLKQTTFSRLSHIHKCLMSSPCGTSLCLVCLYVTVVCSLCANQFNTRMRRHRGGHKRSTNTITHAHSNVFKRF